MHRGHSMSQCKNCQHNKGRTKDYLGPAFVCDDGKCRRTLPCEYLEKEMECPDFMKVE